jgi:DNA mismatch repair protein Mlh1 C-terminus
MSEFELNFFSLDLMRCEISRPIDPYFALFFNLFHPILTLFIQTKKEVHFMFEEEVLEKLFQGVSKRLRASNVSRTFYTQSFLTLNNTEINFNVPEKAESDSSNPKKRKEREVEDGRECKGDDVAFITAEEDDESVRSGRNNLQENRRNGNDGEGEESVINVDDVREGSSSSAESLRKHSAERSDPTQTAKGSVRGSNTAPSSSSSSSASSSHPKPANKLVRTDPSLVKIDSFYKATQSQSYSAEARVDRDYETGGGVGGEEDDSGSSMIYCGECVNGIPMRNEKNKRRKSAEKRSEIPGTNIILDSVGDDDDGDFTVGDDSMAVETIGCQCCGKGEIDKYRKRKITPGMTGNTFSTGLNNTSNNSHNDYRPKMVKFADTKCLYASVQTLLQEIKNDKHNGLENILKNNTFVGIIDGTYCSVQFGTKLLLLDYSTLLFHLFSQLSIRRFAEMSRIILATPLSVRQYVLCALNSPEGGWKKENGEKDKIASCVEKVLIDNSEMLEEYYRIGVNEQGLLCTLPDLLPGYLPDTAGLPMFLLRLATETNWEEEIPCFRSISTEIGHFYSSITADGTPLQDENNEKHGGNENGALGITETDIRSEGKGWRTQSNPSGIFSTLLMPALRMHLVAPKQCVEDGSTVVQIAALEQLYKIFERC